MQRSRAWGDMLFAAPQSTPSLPNRGGGAEMRRTEVNDALGQHHSWRRGEESEEASSPDNRAAKRDLMPSEPHGGQKW